MAKILPKQFYNRKTLQVAQDLLGCFLVRQIDGRKIRAMIVETEAYNGPFDKASHASRGETERNAPMFNEAGIIYVYLIYGMHSMLNIVTEDKGYPAAVLIRAVDFSHNTYHISHSKPKEAELPIGSSASSLTAGKGPAKLTKALKIDRTFNRLPIYTKKHGLWIEDRVPDMKLGKIVKAKRVGIDYAEEYRDKLWRFYLSDNKNVSKK
ncbi:MAG: DNA-3-methyladenine glycosylase [Candidatus Magasanikbacteria bacterium]|nr:DNA-3-methyladenine glycosylase [Candidatus Magasanikbacteria bacterium]